MDKGVVSAPRVVRMRASDLDRAYAANYREIATLDTQEGRPAFQSATDLANRARADARRIGDVNGLQVLEVGPGWGDLALRLEDAGARVSLLDLVPEYLLLLKDRISGDAFLGDVQDFCVPQKFDIVILCDVLEHVFRPADALICVTEVLKPGGKIYVRSPSYEANAHYSLRLGYGHELVHLRTYTRELLRNDLAAVGLRCIVGPKSAYAPGSHPRFAVDAYWKWNRELRREGLNRTSSIRHLLGLGWSKLLRYALAILVRGGHSDWPAFRLRRAVHFSLRGWAIRPPEVWAIARPYDVD